MQPLYTYGYRKGTLRDLKAFVAQGALIVDVRFQPHVNNKTFSHDHLEAVLGDGYRHLPALGNKNYKGGPVDLVDPARGFWYLKCELELRPCVLLCACEEPHQCHRHVIAQQMVAAYPELDGQAWHLAPGFDLNGEPTRTGAEPADLPVPPADQLTLTLD
jgi:hypothetical protein